MLGAEVPKRAIVMRRSPISISISSNRGSCIGRSEESLRTASFHERVSLDSGVGSEDLGCGGEGGSDVLAAHM